MKTTETTSCIEATPVSGHAPSFLPPGKWNLVWHDEFDGDRLDDTKFVHRYGYNECRCRLQQMPDWWTAFWMRSPTQGCPLDPLHAGDDFLVDYVRVFDREG